MNETKKRDLYVAAHILDERAKDDLFMVQNKLANIIAGQTTPEQAAKLLSEKDGEKMMRIMHNIEGNPQNILLGIVLHQTFAFVATKHATCGVDEDVKDAWEVQAEKAFWESVEASMDD